MERKTEKNLYLLISLQFFSFFREEWHSYFTSRGISVIFWSAVNEMSRQEQAEKDAASKRISESSDTGPFSENNEDDNDNDDKNRLSSNADDDDDNEDARISESYDDDSKAENCTSVSNAQQNVSNNATESISGDSSNLVAKSQSDVSNIVSNVDKLTLSDQSRSSENMDQNLDELHGKTDDGSNLGQSIDSVKKTDSTEVSGLKSSHVSRSRVDSEKSSCENKVKKDCSQISKEEKKKMDAKKDEEEEGEDDSDGFETEEEYTADEDDEEEEKDEEDDVTFNIEGKSI